MTGPIRICFWVYLFSLVLTDHLVCDKNSINEYKFNQEVYQEGGKVMTLKLSGKFTIKCIGTSQGKDKESFVRVFTLKELIEEPRNSKRIVVRNVNKPVEFFQGRQGDIFKIFHEKNEKPEILALKKGLITKFVVKLAGTVSVEDTQMGKIEFVYEKSNTLGEEEVVKKISKRILQQADPKGKKRDAHIKSETFVRINNGTITAVESEEMLLPGSPSNRQQKEWNNEKNHIGFEGTPKQMNSKTKQAFDLLTKTKIDHLRKSNVLEVENESNILSLTENHVQGTLALDPQVIALSEERYKQNLKLNTDFRKILSKVRENPTDKDHLALASVYSRHFPEESFEMILDEYNTLSMDKQDHQPHILSLQALLVSTQTEKAQWELIRAMDHPNYVQNAILSSNGFEKPSQELLEKLKVLSLKKFDFQNERRKEIVNTNAYLSLAHLSSKVPLQKAKITLNMIVKNLEKAKDSSEYEKEIHALGNIGDHAPIETLEAVAKNEYLLDNIRTAAIHGLTHRENSNRVTELLHHLTDDTHKESVRLQAIHTLMKRENKYQDGSSVEFLKKYLESPTSSIPLVQAIKDYYVEEASERSTEILKSTKLYQDDHIPNRSEAIKVMEYEGYFEKVKNYVEDIINVFSVKKITEHALNAFRAASFQNGKTCVPVGKVTITKRTFEHPKQHFANKFFRGAFEALKPPPVTIDVMEGDCMCLYDTDMISFVRQQGDLSMMKFSRYVVHESLIGTQALHAYVGVLGYGGTRVDCAKNEFDIAIFGRGAAVGTFFEHRIPFFILEFVFQKRHNQDVKDHILLQILGINLFNGRYLPGKVADFANMCEEEVIPILPAPLNRGVPILDLTIWILVPIRLTVNLILEFRLDAEVIICPGRITLTLALVPSVDFGVSAAGAISFIGIDFGVKAQIRSTYSLRPLVGTSNCNLCFVLSHSLKPIGIDIYLFLGVFGKENRIRDLFKRDLINGFEDAELFRRCLYQDRPFNPRAVVAEENDPKRPINPPPLLPVEAGLEQPFNPPNNPPTLPRSQVCELRINIFKKALSDVKKEIRKSRKSQKSQKPRW